jgi:glutaredoxin
VSASGAQPGGIELTLYTREGCHLCAAALAALRRAQRRAPFELAVVDIDSSEALHRAYFERVPVVQLGGEALFEYVVDEDELAERLSAMRDGRTPIL